MSKKTIIIEKALELFAKQGFEATSVQQITENCGISKGAFYLTFKSKDELILALIDHFMMEIISDIDSIVRTAEETEDLLYKFYYTIFSTFQKHSDFAKVFVKEQMQTVNEDLILRTRYYDRLMDKISLSMIERIYGEEVERTKYDLIFSIKGFINTYSNLFLFYNVPLEIDLLCNSLVDKTNLLARNVTIPFISKDLVEMFNVESDDKVSKEHIIEMLDQKIEEIEDTIVKESLILLKQEVHELSLSRAIVKGLIENVRNHPYCKWISYLLLNYYGL